ncbi:MAG: Flp pilus assembly complex ATPase component TadA [Shewanellaceae bacterium]|nr:Flp pilus assembly complex ATPase component TadA [Shewanellaceae bacterium]
MARLKRRLGTLLVQESVISEAELQAALQQQTETGRKLGQTLVDLDIISEVQLGQFLAKQLQLEFVDLNQRQLSTEVVQQLPEVQARRYRALLLDKIDGIITVALSDPTNLPAQDSISSLFSSAKIHIVVVTESQIIQAFERYYRRTQAIFSMAEQLEHEYSQTTQFKFDLLAPAGESESTIDKLLHTIFEDALAMRASDIHIEPDATCLRIRLRVDGHLQETLIPEVTISAALILKIKLLAQLDISEKRLPQDGRFQLEVKGQSLDVRISTMPIYHGEAVVMRLLDRDGGLLNLNQTGANEEVLACMRTHLQRPHGMILMTGPTGSGKTTTLYGMLNELNQKQRKIITIEDPIEYQLSRINQVQVNPKVGLNFAQVLRTVLRQDPDIIMIGEMRDQETINMGLRGAITGHLVLSTLHTNDAISSVLRLIDMGAAPYLIASSVRLVIAQRLLRRICRACHTQIVLSEAEQAWLAAVESMGKATTHTYRGRGCQACHGTGYAGRIGIFEILEFDDMMVRALRNNDHQAFVDAAKANAGYQPLQASALACLERGETTLEEVMHLVEGSAWLVASNPMSSA